MQRVLNGYLLSPQMQKKVFKQHCSIDFVQEKSVLNSHMILLCGNRGSVRCEKVCMPLPQRSKVKQYKSGAFHCIHVFVTAR